MIIKKYKMFFQQFVCKENATNCFQKVAETVWILQKNMMFVTLLLAELSEETNIHLNGLSSLTCCNNMSASGPFY